MRACVGHSQMKWQEADRICLTWIIVIFSLALSLFHCLSLSRPVCICRYSEALGNWYIYFWSLLLDSFQSGQPAGPSSYVFIFHMSKQFDHPTNFYFLLPIWPSIPYEPCFRQPHNRWELKFAKRNQTVGSFIPTTAVIFFLHRAGDQWDEIRGTVRHKGFRCKGQP